MKRNKHTKFVEVITRYGLTCERGGKHFVVRKDGRQVAVLAGSGEANAMRQAMRDLRRGGHVDDAACREKF